MTALLSTATVTLVGLTCKSFLNSGLCSANVKGLEILRNALEKRLDGQGVITVCNHISTLDDPLTWGILPTRYYLSSRTTRWALGASDVMFTNPVFSRFFSLGQTLETFRGQGIYQPAVDTAIEKLNHGHWVHLYGEGKINQPNTYPRDGEGLAHLPRFKWGVGRILMETKNPPVVIPMWLSGFDQLMPEGRAFPWKYLPKLGVRLSVTFGEPIPPRRIEEALGIDSVATGSDVSPHTDETERLTGWLGEEATDKLEHEHLRSDNPRYARIIRERVTALLRTEVETLGRSVAGPLLDRIQSQSC